ncbi:MULTISPECIES: N-acetylmuramoyl-L-alanine amidase [Streptomyces]|uniref:N-acetylmuramoyl-L-alanine amidase n=1 Tax=Streptomyces TaxID=1883 RepID=UPI000CF29382|nr:MULTISPECIES: N-acetylmuramoyl-L-alanine amidase [Streptomyces]PPS77991.1 N-acetylmuramoyl-L-alanine amidase [Streptomyces sp. 46]
MTHRLLRTAVATALALGALGLTQPARATPSDGVHTVRVPDGDPHDRSLAPRTTEPFSLIGITWDDPDAVFDGSAQVRTRSRKSGAWTAWRPLDTEGRTPEAGPDRDRAGVRGSTQPLWTGPSDGVQVRVTGSRLPEGLRVELVDPEAGSDPVHTAVVEPDGAGPAPGPLSAGRPAVTSRSAWGADESLVKDPPTLTGGTKAMFVHHTAGTNDYTCSQSASIVRGVFLYHVQSNGWNDIGYHFLVDKCGTVFEGRAGGIDKPVLGAHTYGFNTATSSVSVLGDYSTAATNAAVRASVAKVAAWKLGLYGIAPTGTVVLTSGADNGKYKLGQKGTFQRISGHRDGYPTECPGQNLYDDLPEIRTLAANAANAANAATTAAPAAEPPDGPQAVVEGVVEGVLEGAEGVEGVIEGVDGQVRARRR